MKRNKLIKKWTKRAKKWEKLRLATTDFELKNYYSAREQGYRTCIKGLKRCK